MSGKKAIFTKVKNGHEMIGLWYSYYSQFFPESDIYILDFGSSDGSLDSLSCNIEKYSTDLYCPGGGRDNIFKTLEIVNSFKSSLLKKYSTVVYTDYDEILFHHTGLGIFIDRLADNAIATSCGYEIVQIRDIEQPINYLKPIFSQRSYWFHHSAYNKTLILKRDVIWKVGFHSVENLPAPEVTDNLLLLHLGPVDYQRSVNLNIRNIKNFKAIPAEKTRRPCYGVENFYVGNKFESWWKEKEAKARLIPDDLRGLMMASNI